MRTILRGDRLRFIIAVSIVLWCVCDAARAAEWKPHLGVTLMPGTERVIGRLDVFVPIYQNERSLLFADVRAMAASHNVLEGNAGLGFRRLVRDGRWIVGGYGFYDRRRSQHFQNFQQLTFGAEAMSRWFDARVNFYIPEQGRKHYRTGFGQSPARLSGNNAFSGGLLTTKYFERAMHGVDLEIGTQLPMLSNTRAYVAGYHFRTGGAPRVHGGRLRFETRLTDYLTVGSIYQYDDQRGSQGFLELRLRWPPQKPDVELANSYMRRRMTDLVIRDVDIQTNDDPTSPTTLGSSGSQILDGNGDPQEIWYVKNDAPAGGDGTFEAPFDTLAEAEAAAGANDVIYIYEGDGTTTGQAAGVTLANNQMLIGAGVPLRLAGIKFLAAGTHPTLTNAGTIVTLADGNELAGLELDSGTTAITGNNITDFDIHDMIITNPNFGVTFGDVSGTGAFNDNIIMDATNVAFSIQNTTGTLTFAADDNLFDTGGMAVNAGAVLLDFTDATVTATVTNNRFVDQATAGLVMQTSGTGNGTYTATGNRFSDSGQTIVALQYLTEDNATSSATISNNILDDGRIGISIAGTDSAVVTGTASNNTIRDVSKDGMAITATDDASITLTHSTNTIRRSGEQGLELVATNTSDLTVTSSNATINNSGVEGVTAQAADNADVGFTLSNATVTGSASEGIQTVLFDDSTIDQIIENSTLDGNNSGGDAFEFDVLDGGAVGCIRLDTNTSDAGPTAYTLLAFDIGDGLGTLNFENGLEGTNTGAFLKVNTTNVGNGTCSP